MASTNYGTYRPAGAGDRQQTERVIWILVAVVLFLFAFSMGTKTDVEQMTLRPHAERTVAQSDGANGANYALMKGRRDVPH